jgi:hypothetical protein
MSRENTDQSDSEVTLRLLASPGLPVAGLVAAILEAVLDWGDDQPGATPSLTLCEIEVAAGEGPRILRTVWSSRS